ncbi:NCS1 family nucleobase:cation symporter-1 [Jongsikchunia kroppenstedtii]|uniref:NCS1 family nucleobase:cation symporter-1 n=1 Tax=Jongsikchunia kroppenstedtii TaxID=1121721 RepID=UPI000364F53E|nr:NCS1 family nucleobase:cation symporter-1 [Jongsikchunia kroppenstedtii]
MAPSEPTAVSSPDIDPPGGAVATADLSPGLYNEDLAPTKRAGRTWRSYNIFALWANDVHSLGNYGFVLSLFALGLGGWQILVALAAGAVFLFLLLNLSGFMGEKTGVPFPVMSRIAFGIRGSQIPAIIRGVVAIAWFGIQTYLATLVFRVLIVAIAPSAADWDHNDFLGLSTLGWITFLVLWAVQMVIVSYGMETIRKYEAYAGPIIMVTMVALAIWMLTKVDFSIAWTPPHAKHGLDMWVKIIGAAGGWVAIYGTFVLNFCDFTRNAASRRSIVRGNFFGIPINMMIFGAVGVILVGGQFKINGTIIDSPSQVVQTIPNTTLLVLACLALLIVTIAVNLMANFVAPIYALNNLFPAKMNFRRAGMISGTIGLIVLPWNLYDSPTVITYFLGSLGAVLGPLFGIIMADYWMMRRTRVNVPDLYRDRPGSTYSYVRGVNPLAIIALVPSAAIALVVTLVDALKSAADYSWFIGAGAGVVMYVLVTLIADRNGGNSWRRYDDVSGEEIAVPSKH